MKILSKSERHRKMSVRTVNYFSQYSDVLRFGICMATQLSRAPQTRLKLGQNFP